LAAVAGLSIPEVRAVTNFTPWESGVNALAAIAGGLMDATSLFHQIPNLLAFAAVIAGVAVTVRRRSHRWLVASLILLDLLYVAAASNVSALSFVTGLWYGDRGRIGALITIIAIPLACVGLDWARTVLFPSRSLPTDDADPAARRPRWVRPVVAAVSVIARVGGAAVAVRRPGRDAPQGFDVVATPDRPRFVNADELAMMRRLPSELDGKGLVLGDPFTGSVLLYAVTGRGLAFGSLTGTWDKDRKYLLKHFPELDTNPKVCQALDRLGIDYLYTDPVLYYDTDDYASLTKGMDLTKGLTLIDQGGGAAVYKITACAPDQVRGDGR
jgi:hypothetical protein